MKSLKVTFIIVLAILITIILPSFSFAETEVNTVLLIKEAIATWYYIIRFIAIAVMLVILIFIGIKIALSNIASDRAFYQRMLMDWVAGMILVFGIHYIMIFILELNQLIVDMVANVSEEIYEADPSEYGGLDYKEKDNEDIESSIFETVRTRAYDPKLINGTMGMIMYIYLVYYAYKFTFIYLKRYLMVGILTIMAPVVAVSYAFTKVLTGKTKIFSTWLKEYFFNVILQSIHAIIYVTFVMSALKLSLNSLSGMLLAFILLNFMSKADKIFRTIFAIGGNGSLVDDLNNIVEKKPSELADDIRNVGAAYLGNKTMRKLAKKERETLFFKPAQKAFGGVMAFKANHSKENSEKYEYEKEDGTKEKTEFLKKDIERFENNEKLNNIIALEDEIDELRAEQARNKKEAKKKEEELQKLIAKKLQEEADEEEKKAIEIEIEAKEDEIEALTHEKEIFAKQQELEIKMDEFSKSKEALTFALKEKFRNAFDYEKYTEKITTRKGKEKYVGIRNKYIEENGRRVKVDSVGIRMKQYINAESILGCTEDDKKLLKENMGELKDVTVGFFKGLFSLALFVDSPLLATGIGASAYANTNQLLSSYLAKNKISYIDSAGIETDKALTVANVMFLCKTMSKQLNDAKDEYIVNSINKKHKKFVKLLTKGMVVATTGVAGSRYIRKFSPRKDAPKDAVFFRKGGLGYTEREHAIQQFNSQDRLNRRVESVLINNTHYNIFDAKAEEEIKDIHENIQNMSADDTIKQFAVMSAMAVAVNGIYIPTTDKELDGNTILNEYEQNIELFQQDTSVTETNPDRTPVENKTEIKQEEKTIVTVQGKTIQITDKQIEDIIVKVAKDNNYKTVTEFTSQEKSNHEIICKQIEEELIQKQIQNVEVEIPKEELKVVMSAIDNKIEKGKAKIVVSEITTNSFEEAIKENGTTEVEKIEAGIVTEKAEQKLQEWVQINNEQIQERNPALQQLQNMKKNLSSEGRTQLPDTRTKQSVLGDKSIEQVMNKAVQARYHSISKFNSKSSNSPTTEENVKKLKEKIAEKRTEELQQLLVDAVTETSQKRVNELIDSVPTRQGELVYLVREMQNDNIIAKDLGVKNKNRKHLQFETIDSSSAINSLSKLAEKEKGIKDTYDSKVKDVYDSRVREQDTRIDSSGGTRVSSTTKKINVKQVPGVEGPLADLNQLLASLNT